MSGLSLGYTKEKSGMFNNIQSNNKKQQTGFAMSEWRNVKLLATNPRIDLNDSNIINEYLTKEAPLDGHNVLITVIKPHDHLNKITVYVEKNLGFFKNKLRGLIPKLLRCQELTEPCNSEFPAEPLRILAMRAAEYVKAVDEEKAFIAAKKNALQKK